MANGRSVWRPVGVALALLAVLMLFLGYASAARVQRLPLEVTPRHYTLSFAPDLAAERFRGDAAIRVSFREPLTRIVLHAVDLDIDRAIVRAHGTMHRVAVSTQPDAETITLDLAAPLPPSEAEVVVSYTGPLRDDLRGLYISRAHGRKYAVTQLEATDARRLFPSFDEPRYKATFDIRVTAPPGDTVISNAPLETVTVDGDDGRRRFDFATTLPMSTYLVAIAVGDFECAERKVGSTPLRVCATPGGQQLSGFALDAATVALRYFNDYFDYDYPFQKLDLVAIPDFAAGAMENTGAAFFRESLLLVAPDAAVAVKKRAATVIAHELAHMWFGNLVTMRWWDDLWLNEGFATWMETKALAAWRPEWDLELDERQGVDRAMTIDSRGNKRAIRAVAETPAQIEALFDAITYEKAAAVIGMTERFVGEDRWRSGVNAYLSQFRYANASAEDFWNTMARDTGRPVDRIMRSFVTTAGVPLVNVATACRGADTAVTLSQRPFSTRSATSAPSLWTIPVCLETRGDAKADSCHVLDRASLTVTLPGCARWVVGNDNAEGYYRTQHDRAALERLIRANAELASEERLMLITDMWALWRAGLEFVGPLLQLTRALAADVREPEVIAALGARLHFMHEYLTTSASKPLFERWVADLFAGALTASMRLEADSETALTRRAALIGIVGAIGRDAELLRLAKREVDFYLSGQHPGLQTELLDAYVALAALDGGAQLYDRYRERAERSRTPEERYRYLFALAAFRSEALARRTFDYALSPEVRGQDRALLIGRLFANPVARHAIWLPLQRQWAEVQRRLGSFSSAGIIVDALGNFCSHERAAEVRTLLTVPPMPGLESRAEQTIETIEQCAELTEGQRSALASAIESPQRR
jgi:puromycin-sensitive aminopeptidase